MSAREDRARALVVANTDKKWDDMSPTERDVYRRQATREGFTSAGPSDGGDPTDGQGHVATAARGRLDDLTHLYGAICQGDDLDTDALKALGVEVGPDDDPGWMAEEAAERMREYPLSIETSTVFTIVLGTGGPDDRLIVECDCSEDVSSDDQVWRREYEIRRISYRYSWTGSGEIVLSGEDYNVAEAFARQVIPELE